MGSTDLTPGPEAHHAVSRSIRLQPGALGVVVHSTEPMILPLFVDTPGGSTNRSMFEGIMYEDNCLPDGRPYWCKGALVRITWPVRKVHYLKRHDNGETWSDFPRDKLALGPLSQPAPRKITLD